MLEKADIQGLVLSGYATTPHSRYWLVRLQGEGARPWLGRLIPRVTTGTRRERTLTRRLNVALSATGLCALGLSEAALATFPREFSQGMADPERSLVLGDVDRSAPEQWEFGRNDATGVDAVLFSYAATAAELDDASELIEDELERFGLEGREEDSYLPSDGREHFGFKYALTNVRLGRVPRLRGQNPYDPSVPPGEFVLGYLNAARRFPASPTAPMRTGTRRMPRVVDAQRAMDLGENGTYVVLRKLAQDVPGFWRFAEREGALLFPGAPDGAQRFASQLVGRTPDGVALSARPKDGAREGDINRFGYREEDGAVSSRCPLGAHVRRANPRDGLGDAAGASLAHVRAHRLIRRGRLFGPPASGPTAEAEERGLLFVALCADLRRQFEFVQQSWLNNPKFAGLTHERDPLVGSGPRLESAGGEETFSLQSDPLRRRAALERFVTVRGGAYLFMPGLRGLAYLAEP